MKRTMNAASQLGLLMVFASTIAGAGAEGPDRLVALEREFAAAVAAEGMSPAFARFLGEDGHIFRPEPTLGRAFHLTNSVPGRLEWVPEIAVMSAAGDLGFTTGPWQYFADAKGTNASGAGHYLSVWQRNENAGWKVAADIGVSHPPVPLEGLKPSLTQLPVLSGAKLNEDGSLKEKLEARLRDLAAGIDRPWAENARLYRNGRMPYVGAAAIRAGLASEGTLTRTRVDRLIMSECGTIACVHGVGKVAFEVVASRLASADASFLQVWIRADDGGWKLKAEVALQLPDKPAD
ncbi:MAG TPA: hypothetical protein DCY13_18830 [Verrucomicrobiales bacterium]|nr:hypothetical protein [Verrucomicrobiales bacterium]